MAAGSKLIEEFIKKMDMSIELLAIGFAFRATAFSRSDDDVVAASYDLTFVDLSWLMAYCPSEDLECTFVFFTLWTRLKKESWCPTAPATNHFDPQSSLTLSLFA